MPIPWRVLLLVMVLVCSYLWIWFYKPTTTLANLPYCLKGLESQSSGINGTDSALTGIFMAQLPKPEPFEPNFRPQGHIIILIRFNGDGRLMYAMSAYNRYINWHEISSWFNWDSPGLKVSYANYERNGNDIRVFVDPASAGNFPSSSNGEITDGMFTLENIAVLWHNEEGSLVFQSFIVETCPFTGK